METVFWFGGSFGFFCLENGGSSILRNIVVYTKVHVGISRKTTVCGILSFYGLQIFQAPECLHMVSALVVYTSQSAFYWIPLMSLYVVLLCCLQLKWPVSRSPYLTSDHSDMVHRPLIRNLNEISGLPNKKKKKTGKLVSYNILSVRWKSHTIVFCVFQEALKNMSLLNKTFFFTIVWPCIVTDSLWMKPTDALNSNFIGITTLHVSGSLSAHHQEFLVYIGIGAFYADLMTVCYQK